MKPGKIVSLLYLAGTVALLLTLGVIITDSPKSPVPLEYVYWEDEPAPAPAESSAVSREEPPASVEAKGGTPPVVSPPGVPRPAPTIPASPPTSSEPVKRYLTSSDKEQSATPSRPDAPAEPAPEVPPPDESSRPQDDGFSTPNYVVNLNTATTTELQSLDGIGPVLAQRILDFRTQAGGFQSVEDLLSVSGIGEKKLAAIRNRVTV